MTNRAKPVSEIELADAENELAEALAEPASSGSALEGRQRAIDRARGMVRAAKSAG